MSLPPKSRRIPPLETIYEESGSYASSILPRQQVLNSPYHSQAINGLISARSIATVDIHRQRVHPSTKKPPIEVRFRDGSKRFIQSSSLVLNNGRSLFHSSPLPQQHQLSSEKPIVQSNGHPSPAHPLKTPLVFTIITADDLERAGATPSICSSPDEFDRSYLTQSFSVSSVETMRSLKDTSHVSSGSRSTLHMLSPSNSYRSTMTPARSDSFTSLQSSSVTPNRMLSMQSLDRSGSSLTFSSSNQESSRSASSVMPYDEPVKQAAPSALNGLFNNELHSAFRPIPHPSRLPLPVSIGPQRPVMPPFQNYRARAPTAAQQTPNNNRHSVAGVPHFDAATWHSHTRTQPNSSTNALDLPSVMSNGWNGSLKSEGQPSVTIDPSTKWYNITSNSIYDIPRLSSNYANVPLHITVPVLTPVHHRRSLIQHDDGLEKRLLNAGLSPETVALYERILRVADRSSIAGLSAMNTLNQYSIRS